MCITQGPNLVDTAEVQTSLIPGLAPVGQVQHGDSFKGWENSEKGGALKSMFFWKKQPRCSPSPMSPPMPPKEQSFKLKTTKSSPVVWTCNEDIDRTVYKVLTKGRGNRSKPMPKVACLTNGWRGPRDELSEVPTQRKVSTKKSPLDCQVV